MMAIYRDFQLQRKELVRNLCDLMSELKIVKEVKLIGLI